MKLYKVIALIVIIGIIITLQAGLTATAEEEDCVFLYSDDIVLHQIEIENNQFVFPEQAPQKENFIFIGWLREDTIGPLYAPGSVFEYTKGSKNFVAVWQKEEEEKAKKQIFTKTEKTLLIVGSCLGVLTIAIVIYFRVIKGKKKGGLIQ
ncbi:MAG: hypothetical protein LBD17_00450 [Endomicrobium sp.]|jgi:hypothetical protein|nr:hypothetical protein [Endomicrobium sp.]